MLCFARSLTLLTFAAGFAVVLTSQAQSGSGTKATPTGTPSAAQVEVEQGGGEQPAESETSGLSDAQRQLCMTAFANGSGTKFTDQAAFDAACMALFPPQFGEQADAQNES